MGTATGARGLGEVPGRPAVTVSAAPKNTTRQLPVPVALIVTVTGELEPVNETDWTGPAIRTSPLGRYAA